MSDGEASGGVASARAQKRARTLTGARARALFLVAGTTRSRSSPTRTRRACSNSRRETRASDESRVRPFDAANPRELAKVKPPADLKLAIKLAIARSKELRASGADDDGGSLAL